MERKLLRISAGIGCVCMVVVLSTCTTVKISKNYRFDGSTIYPVLRTPPPPTVDVDYNLYIDKNNPIKTFASIATNVAKASYAGKAEELMNETLDAVDIPEVVFEESFAGIVTVLNAHAASDRRNAEYIYDLEIRRFGIRAPGGTLEFTMDVTARLYNNRENDLIWRRDIHTSEPVRSAFFGIDSVVDDVLSLGFLAELTVEQIVKGFRNTAIEAARKITRSLENDYYLS